MPVLPPLHRPRHGGEARSRRRLAPPVLAAVALLAAPVHAQRLQLTVTDSVSGAPVSAALVAAVDADGAVLVERLSDRDGAALLPLPRASTVRVRVRRIGLRPVVSAPVAVPAEGTTTLALRVQRIEQPLPTVVVEARDCRPSPRAEELWERMRIALQSAALRDADTTRAIILASSVQRRVLSPSLRLLREGDPVERVGRGRIFTNAGADRSLLLTQGFVRHQPDGTVAFFAPDDADLASDEFRRAHCFTTPRRDTVVGLAEVRFVPTPARRGIPGISGSAFVDTASGEPRHVAFRYEIPFNAGIVRGDHAGGAVRVQRLDDGTWIVSDWSIRMPTGYRETMLSPIEVANYHEVVGRATPIDSATLARRLAARREAEARVPVQVAIAVVREGDLESVGGATISLGSLGQAVADLGGLTEVSLPRDTTIALRVTREGFEPAAIALRTGQRDTTLLVRMRRVGEVRDSTVPPAPATPEERDAPLPTPAAESRGTSPLAAPRGRDR